MYCIDKRQTNEKKGRLQNQMDHCQIFNFLCLKNFYSRWVSYLRYFSYLLKFLILASKKLDTSYITIIKINATEYGSKNSSIKKHQRQIQYTCFTRIYQKTKLPKCTYSTFTFSQTNNFRSFIEKSTHIESSKKRTSSFL